MKALRVALLSLLLSACGVASVPGTLTPPPTQPPTATGTSTLTPTSDMARTQHAIVGATFTEQAASKTEAANQAASSIASRS